MYFPYFQNYCSHPRCKHQIITSLHIIIYINVIVIPSFAQDSLREQYPKVWIGMNLGVHFDNPGLKKSNIDYSGTPKTSSENDLPYISLFMANRISQNWNINTGLGFMNSITSVNATYISEDVNRDIRLLGELNQSVLSFSWKIEYWMGNNLYINTGPAFNMVLHSEYENRARDSPDYVIDHLVSEQNSFWGWQSNFGYRVTISSFALQANLGYLWGEQVDGPGGQTPNLLHRVFSFSLGLVSEF